MKNNEIETELKIREGGESGILNKINKQIGNYIPNEQPKFWYILITCVVF